MLLYAPWKLHQSRFIIALTVALSSILSRRNSLIASASASSVGTSELGCVGACGMTTGLMVTAFSWVITIGFSTATDGILFKESYNNSESVFDDKLARFLRGFMNRFNL